MLTKCKQFDTLVLEPKAKQSCKGEKACACIHSSCCILTLLFCCCMQSNVFPFKISAPTPIELGVAVHSVGPSLFARLYCDKAVSCLFLFLHKPFIPMAFTKPCAFTRAQRATTYTQAMQSGHTTLNDFNLIIFIFTKLCRLFRIQICKSRRGLRRLISRHCCYICSLEAKSTATMLVSPTCDKTFFVKPCRQSNTATLPICIFSPQP